MKYILLLTYMFISFSLCNAGEIIKKQKKVLFLGNSVIFYNNMPLTLQKMIDEQNLNIKIDQLTFPGWLLVNHATLVERYIKDQYVRAEGNEIPISVKKILSEKWDMVILQEIGGFTLIPEFNEISFEPSLIFLDSIIKSINSKTVLFQEYSTNNFPWQICKNKKEIETFYSFIQRDDNNNKYTPMLSDFSCCSKSFKNSSEKFYELKNEFDFMAKKLNAGLVKVGFAFEGLKKKYPNISVYASEEDPHPSPQGSYLIACLFFKYVTGKNLKNVKYAAGLDQKDALLIRQFADIIK